MSATVEALDREINEREAIKARCKIAPITGIISSRNALQAWNNYLKYRSKADFAYTRYMQAGIGTVTQRRYLIRYEAFSDVAEGWERLLESWLKNEAQIEGA